MKQKSPARGPSFFKIHAAIFTLFTVCFWLAALVNVSDGRSVPAASAGIFLASRLIINLMWGVVLFLHFRTHQHILRQTQATYEQAYEEKIKRGYQSGLDLEEHNEDGVMIDEIDWIAEQRLQSK